MRLPPLLLLALIACDGTARDPSVDGGTNRDAGVAPRDGGADAVDTCADGAARSFYSLYEVSPVPEPSALNLPAVPASANVVSAEVDQVSMIRVEVCTPASGAPRVASIFWGGLFYGLAVHWIADDTVFSPTQRLVSRPYGEVTEYRLGQTYFVVEGLAEAITGDPSALDLRVLGPGGVLLVGHADFVAAARGEVTEDGITYDTSVFTAGRFGAGDILADLKCTLSEWSRTERFELGTARFAVDGCFFAGGGHTEGYRIVGLTIEDDNAALDPANHAPVVFASEAAVDVVMNFNWHHHNGCDSFYVELPHAEYAASAAPLAGCGPVVDNAPEREFGEPSDSNVKYRVRYGDGAWEDGEIEGCWHYLFCER